MGCDKYHRDRYIGDWDFVTNKCTYVYNNDLQEWSPIEYDTIYYTGKIAPGNLEYELIIQYTNNDIIDAHIDEDGTTLWTDAYPCARCSSGSFEKKNKVYLNLVFNKQDKKINDHINGIKKSKK